MESAGIMQSGKFSNVPVSVASKTQSLDLHGMFAEPSSVHWRKINGNYNRKGTEMPDSNAQKTESGTVAVFRSDTATTNEVILQEFSHAPKRLRSEDLRSPPVVKQESSFISLDSVGMMQSLHKDIRPLSIPENEDVFWNSGNNNSWVPSQLPSPRSYNPLDEPSPLGLRLRKSPSLLELISMSVAQGSSSGSLGVGPSSDAMQGFVKNKDALMLNQDKLKASNFPAAVLKIGSWECYSRYEGDLVAKCYYAKRKLVWEVLENGLKSKIEIQWSDISSLKASCPENEPGTLEIEVSRPPLFFRELNPQPRKHTLWQTTADFTGGEATISRRHYLQFLEGVLNKHYEKLLQCDSRLKALATDVAASKGGSSSTTQHAKQETETLSHDERQDHLHLSRNSTMPPSENFTTAPRFISKLELGFQPSFQTPSPSSVMDTRGGEETGSSDGDFCVKDESSGLHSEGTNFLASPVSKDNVEHESLCSSSKLVGDHTRFLERNVLDEIAQVLLGESLLSIASNEEASALASRVHAMSASLAQDVQYNTPLATPHTVNPFSDYYANNNLPARPESEVAPHCRRGEEMEDVKPHRERNVKWELNGMVENNSESSKPWLSKTNSAVDLLVNLPRIASLPQFFDSQTQRPF